jgi:hypothetical protein
VFSTQYRKCAERKPYCLPYFGIVITAVGHLEEVRGLDVSELKAVVVLRQQYLLWLLNV